MTRKDPEEWKEIRAAFAVFTKWFISGLMDAAFLILWVFIQWGTQKIIANLVLSGIDNWVFSAFQVLFAFSTLAPVVIYIYVDIRVMLLKAKRRIRREIELDEKASRKASK